MKLSEDRVGREPENLAALHLTFVTLSSSSQVPLLSLYCHVRTIVSIGKILLTQDVLLLRESYNCQNLNAGIPPHCVFTQTWTDTLVPSGLAPVNWTKLILTAGLLKCSHKCQGTRLDPKTCSRFAQTVINLSDKASVNMTKHNQPS